MRVHGYMKGWGEVEVDGSLADANDLNSFKLDGARICIIEVSQYTEECIQWWYAWLDGDDTIVAWAISSTGSRSEIVLRILASQILKNLEFLAYF